MKKWIKSTLSVTVASLLVTPGVFATSDPVLDNSDKVKTEPAVVNTNKETVKSTVPAFKKRIYREKPQQEKVLVVLMDFPNNPNNTITPQHTDNYHPAFNKKYYEQLFFGDSYTGPDGQSYDSIKSFYQQVSGNSLNLTGKVSGWHRAKYPIQHYGGNDANYEDKNVSTLIMEAAAKAAKDKSINMNEFDQYDYYDMDGDGKISEPDGLIDKLVVVYSGVGESEGGGKFGKSSIWEHVSEVEFSTKGEPKTIPGTKSKKSKFYKNRLAVAEYGALAEDSTVGTFSHEFGHMLGLIDEYDTTTSQAHAGEPVRFWSLMSYGADAGSIPGMNPVGLSPMAKSDLQQIYGGNWMLGTELSYKHITSKKRTYLLDQASIKGVNNDVIKINLPPIRKKAEKGKYKSYKNYYLLEWRSHNGVDKGLSMIKDPFGNNHYGKGLVIWYVDESYSDNSNLVKHFGKSLVGVVDASPKIIQSKDGMIPMTDIQIFDAAFNNRSYGNFNDAPNYYFKKSSTKPNPLFYDKNYSKTAFNKLAIKDSARILPQLGIKIKVEDQNSDGTVGKISIYK